MFYFIVDILEHIFTLRTRLKYGLNTGLFSSHYVNIPDYIVR